MQNISYVSLVKTSFVAWHEWLSNIVKEWKISNFRDFAAFDMRIAAHIAHIFWPLMRQGDIP